MLALLMLLETEEDRVSFRVLYEETYLKFIHVANGILHNQNDAEEIVHDIYVKWADDYKKYRNKSLDEMLRLGIVMTRNRCIDLIRKRNTHNEIPIEIDDDLFEDPHFHTTDDVILDDIINEENITELVAAIKKLTPDEQTILALNFDAGFSYKEIAKEMDLKVSNVKMKLYRIKKKLREELTYEQD